MKITKQRLKQIILEEVTNRLLAESSTNLDPSQFAAFVKDKKGGFSIYLYKYDYSDTYNPVEVIGSINVQKTQMPCIPQQSILIIRSLKPGGGDDARHGTFAEEYRE